MVQVNEDFDPRDVNENKPSIVERTRTTNEEGGEAFEPFTPEFDLFKQVINNLLEDTYYQEADEQLQDVVRAFNRAADENPEYPLQLAVYARQEEGFRDIAQVLLVLSAYDERTKEYVREYAPAIIDRTDEFNTVVALALNLLDSYPNKPLKKGIEDALHKKYVVFEFESGVTERLTYIEDDIDRQQYDPTADNFSPWDQAMEVVHQYAKSRFGHGFDGEGGPFEHECFGGEILDEGYVHDEYTFSKYQQRDKEVSLHDVINLVRPAPRSDNRDEMFGRIVKGELDDYEEIEPLREERTWESELSDDDDRSDAEKFRERLDDMGLMARVRNLRNMLEAGLSGEEIFDYDANGEFGENSRQVVKQHQMFPFRFYQAYHACGDVGISSSGFGRNRSFNIGRGNLLDRTSDQWLNQAIDVATENLPETLENTFTSIDLSGSMDSPVSGKSEMARAEIASLFGAMLMKRDSDAGAFGDSFATIEADEAARRNTGTLEIAKRIYEVGDSVGNATNGWKTLKWAVENDEEYDRFVVFTDEQIWDSTGGLLSSRSDQTLKKWWDRYTDEVNPDAHLYVIDTAAYGDLSMPEGYPQVHQISGWSESVVEFVDKYEQADDVVAEIEAIDPDDY